MDLVKIGSFLQKLRKEKNFTQEQLAEQLGVSRRTVSRWETGSNMPDLDVLMELSDLYTVDLREILNGERKNLSLFLSSTSPGKTVPPSMTSLAAWDWVSHLA